MSSCTISKLKAEDQSNQKVKTSPKVSTFLENSDSLEHKSCKGCIGGSSTLDNSLRVRKSVYFLYGAEHLKLKNYYFDIPVVYNSQVKKWIRYFLNKGKPYFIRYSERAGRYAPVMGKILSDAGLPRDLIFLAMAESGFQNKAKSWAKAVGPWQFMPYTGKNFGLKIDWYVDERRDPIKATIAASRYLGNLYERFGSWELAAAAYNAGEGKVGRAVRRYRTENFWKIRKGRYLKSETKNYVPKIMALAIIGKNLQSFGFKDIDFNEPLDFEEVVVPNNTDLVSLSEALQVSFDEIQRLNPELLRWETPPNVEEYTLRVPVGKAAFWDANCKDKDFAANAYQVYKVRGSKATLKQVARKYKIKKPVVLSWLNSNISVNKRLKRGTEVKLPFRVDQTRKEPMYADLYELPSRRVRRRRAYRSLVRIAKRRGRLIKNPSVYYTVQRGDSLWSVSRKSAVPLYTLIKSNLNIINRRMIRAGDRLAIR